MADQGVIQAQLFLAVTFKQIMVGTYDESTKTVREATSPVEHPSLSLSRDNDQANEHQDNVIRLCRLVKENTLLLSLGHQSSKIDQTDYLKQNHPYTLSFLFPLPAFTEEETLYHVYTAQTPIECVSIYLSVPCITKTEYVARDETNVEGVRFRDIVNALNAGAIGRVMEHCPVPLTVQLLIAICSSRTVLDILRKQGFW